MQLSPTASALAPVSKFLPCLSPFPWWFDDEQNKLFDSQFSPGLVFYTAIESPAKTWTQRGVPCLGALALDFFSSIMHDSYVGSEDNIWEVVFSFHYGTWGLNSGCEAHRARIHLPSCPFVCMHCSFEFWSQSCPYCVLLFLFFSYYTGRVDHQLSHQNILFQSSTIDQWNSC